MLSLYLTRLYKTVSRFIPCSQLAPREALGQSSWDLPWSLGGWRTPERPAPGSCYVFAPSSLALCRRRSNQRGRVRTLTEKKDTKDQLKGGEHKALGSAREAEAERDCGQLPAACLLLLRRPASCCLRASDVFLRSLRLSQGACVSSALLSALRDVNLRLLDRALFCCCLHKDRADKHKMLENHCETERVSLRWGSVLAGRSAKARNEDDWCRRPFHAGAGFTRGEIAQTSAIPPGEVQGPLCSLCWEKNKVLGGSGDTRLQRGFWFVLLPPPREGLEWAGVCRKHLLQLHSAAAPWGGGHWDRGGRQRAEVAHGVRGKPPSAGMGKILQFGKASFTFPLLYKVVTV